MKPESDFYKNCNKKNGLQSNCKECDRANSNLWAKDNSERLKEYNRARYLENCEDIKAKSRAWARDNPDKKRSSALSWRVKNADRKSASNRAWYERNVDKVISRSREWVKANPAARKASLANYKAKISGLNNPGIQPMQHELDSLLDESNGMCVYCTIRPFEHWDHIIPRIKLGSLGIENHAASCAKCNTSKNARMLNDWHPRHIPKENQWWLF